MKTPMPPPIWQGSAQTREAPVSCIENRGTGGHCFHTGYDPTGRGPRIQCCFPTPSPRSGRSPAGPTPSVPRVGNPLPRHFRKHFQKCDIAVESAAITTNLRGSLTCGNRLSSLLFFPPLWPAACRILHRAGWLVPRQALWSPMRLMKTCLPGPRLAVWPVSQHAASKSASGPATDPFLTAFGRFTPLARTIRAGCPGGSLRFAA